ncbi:Lipid A core - O-antigen ligase and related enzymes [Serratia entomophila]|uniref:O-antigen ligase family protein n=1 Tax=Serratia entomophila TaxID=42906 RepID=A0ABY5CSD1_9GAMM|nr:O-antigen ligase family protein [Serratia entomophila]UIW18328.1 O-antigen ligase family protein [Serratia entomophila]USV00897.1 O-antigen ligase family protein [Serratia entomophila]CAI0795939.1 Lipid A core - O-antigen ligase and related enzymes [Serratia entomophila]CAI1083991.1 Lipid A core - O-antigen ligase and related enzymes [Serratia entomophila]CAI1086971.1 Lipid A core - O-antigen ligase and related enzymes [Serratia entomophila]
MNFSNNTFRPQKLYVAFFFLFSFFSAIFCNYTKVNNLFHLAAIFFIITLYLDKDLRLSFWRNKEVCCGLGFATAMLFYFSLSNLWSNDPANIESTLTHSLYLLLYLAMLIATLNGPRRNLLLTCIVLGLTILCLYSIAFDYQDMLVSRQVSKSNPGPGNVIDLSGLAGLGIILSLSLFSAKHSRAILITIPILFGTMLLTQSRGPVLALLIALAATLPYNRLKLKHVVGFLVALVAIAAAILPTEMGQLMLTRLEEMYAQSFLRLSIWRHTFELVAQAPYFGYGFDYELTFTNYSGEFIRTTHSLYWGTLLKGGLVGLGLLLALLSYCGVLAVRRLRSGMRLEAALLVFMLLFYVSQGMFVVGNPSESWYLFWFPLGVVMTARRHSREV